MNDIPNRFVQLIAVLCLNALTLGQTQDKLHIAVTDLTTQGGVSQQEVIVLSSRLRSRLVETNAFILLDRGLMEEILKEQGFQQSGCTTTECAVEIGRILNVERIVTGTIGRIGALYTIDIALIDVSSSQFIKSLTRDYQGEIEGLIEEMRSIANELAGLSVPVTTKPTAIIPAVSNVGVVEIVSIPPQASIYIDGIKLGLTPFKLNELKAGEHTIKISKKGYINHEEPFSVETNQIKKLEISLERLNLIKISSKPSGVLFYLNNELKGSTPVVLELRTGTYKLKLAKDGFAEWEREITLNKDYTPTITMLKMYNISFSSNPLQADVFLDNQYVGTTPVKSMAAEGQHTVKIHLDNYRDFESHIKLKKDIQVKAKLKYSDEYRRQLVATGEVKSSKKVLWIGVGAVAVGGAAYILLSQEDEPKEGSVNITIYVP